VAGIDQFAAELAHLIVGEVSAQAEQRPPMRSCAS
jgi:hypothetical protein